uniref:Uncharacterized protein n=1 Tax=Salix viminalis TaxID=40686 RepID=A0A6N2M4A6_SALVM
MGQRKTKKKLSNLREQSPGEVLFLTNSIIVFDWLTISQTLDYVLVLLADSWESLDAWLDATRLVYTIYARGKSEVLAGIDRNKLIAVRRGN